MGGYWGGGFYEETRRKKGLGLRVGGWVLVWGSIAAHIEGLLRD